jgi:hypothetical protein
VGFQGVENQAEKRFEKSSGGGRTTAS